MKYTKENINIPFGIITFWGNQPSKSGEITKSCLSQWWELNPFFIQTTNDIIKYISAEHYMMAQKALLFNDNETRN